MADVYDNFQKCMQHFKLCSKYAQVDGSSKYKNVIASIGKVMTTLNRLSTPDKSGKVPPLTEKDYTELLSRMGKLRKSIKNFQSTMGSHNALPVARAMSGIRSLVDRDLYELKNIPIDGKTDINELLDRVRGKALAVQTGEKTQIKKAATSERIPVQFTENGKTVTGFFTKDRIHDINNDTELDRGLFKLGAEEGSSISDRNIAMTRVADLLSCSRLAHSSKMKLEIDGQTYNGVFMKTAEGEDIFGSATAAEKRKFLKHDYSGEALRQMSDIQIVDFICLNADRHEGNMLYSSRNENGVQIITGVMGIDHDYSFGTLRRITGRNESEEQLENIKMCSKSMAVKLCSMSEEMFRYAFKDLGLKEEEIYAAWDRAQALVEKIEDKEIEVVDDDQFYEKKEALLGTQRSLFSKAESAISHQAEYAQTADPQERGAEPPHYVNAEPLSYIKKNREYIADRLTRMRISLENSKGFWTKSTENFTRMMAAVSTIETDAQNFNKGIIPEEAFRADLEKLGQALDRYTEYKKNNMVGFGTVARERMALTAELKHFVDETLSGERELPDELTHKAGDQPEEDEQKGIDQGPIIHM